MGTRNDNKTLDQNRRQITPGINTSDSVFKPIRSTPGLQDNRGQLQQGTDNALDETPGQAKINSDHNPHW